MNTRVQAGITRLIDTPAGPVRRYYPTRAEQLEQQRRDRERNLRQAAARRASAVVTNPPDMGSGVGRGASQSARRCRIR